MSADVRRPRPPFGTVEEEEAAQRYEGAVAAALAAKGKRIVRIVCEKCQGRNASTLASVYDTPNGVLFERTDEFPSALPLILGDRDVIGHRQRPATTTIAVLLDVPLSDRPLRVNDADVAAAVLCPKHGRLGLAEQAVLEAVQEYRRSGKSQWVLA